MQLAIVLTFVVLASAALLLWQYWSGALSPRDAAHQFDPLVGAGGAHSEPDRFAA